MRPLEQVQLTGRKSASLNSQLSVSSDTPSVNENVPIDCHNNRPFTHDFADITV
jgi:hypothetical protein